MRLSTKKRHCREGARKEAHREVRPPKQKKRHLWFQYILLNLRANPKSRGRTQIGRANLLVSQILIYAIIDQKDGLVTRVREKRLTGRYALPNKKK